MHPATAEPADRFCAIACPGGRHLGDILWGTFWIENEDGAWEGTSVGTTDVSTGGEGVTYYQLVGTGAYEGLSAVIFETEVPTGDPVWNGVIFPGELPPER